MKLISISVDIGSVNEKCNNQILVYGMESLAIIVLRTFQKLSFPREMGFSHREIIRANGSSPGKGKGGERGSFAMFKV